MLPYAHFARVILGSMRVQLSYGGRGEWLKRIPAPRSAPRPHTRPDISPFLDSGDWPDPKANVFVITRALVPHEADLGMIFGGARKMGS